MAAAQRSEGGAKRHGRGSQLAGREGGLLTGIEGGSSRPMRKIVVIDGL